MAVITTTQVVIPSTQQDLDEINTVLGNVVDSMIRMDGEKEYISDAIKTLSKKHNVPAKLIKQVAKMKHMANSVEAFQEQESLEILWDSLNTKQIATP